MRIVYPDHPLVKPLVEHIQRVCAEFSWTCLEVTEAKAADMLLKGMADVALTTPLGYGMGVGKVDYRIINSTILQLDDYTETMGISFNPMLVDIASYATKTPNDYLSTIGQLVLAEKFDTPLVMLPEEKADFIIDYNQPGVPTSMDVAEEWFDTMQVTLPWLIWVCRIDADIDNLPSAITNMASTAFTSVLTMETMKESDVHTPRQGNLLYRWMPETEDALLKVLEFLYFHQVLPELPAIKMLGRD